jgi:hypothetical protein
MEAEFSRLDFELIGGETDCGPVAFRVKLAV